MPYELYVEVANFTVAAIFTKDDKSKLSKAMTAAATAALVKSKVTVAKKTPKTKNFTLGGALTVEEKGAGARATVAIQLNQLPGDKLYGMATGGAETNDLNLIEDLAAAVVKGVVEQQITKTLKKAADKP
jgi:hypothetical protein